MKVGILGYEYAGRRSLFSVLTGVPYETVCRQASGCVGAVPVPDHRVDRLASMYHSRKKVYTQVVFSLLPPVRKEAAETRNALAEAREVDLFAVVVRGFSDPSVFNPTGPIDPARDCQGVLTEMVFADLSLIETRLERIEKLERVKPAEVNQLEKKTLLLFREHLESGRLLNTLSIDEASRRTVQSLQFLTMRPIFAVVNCDEGNAIPSVHATIPTINISVKLEMELQQLPAEDRREFMDSLGIKESSLDRMVRFAYEAGGLHTFLTAGERETRSWTIRRGATALEAAGTIHSDFEKGFIRAEVVAYDDLIAAGSEAEAKRRGLYRLEGRDYIVRDGDVMLFRFNV